MEKKKLATVTKSISDFIPKRSIPDDVSYKKQARRVKENYMIEIQDAVSLLVQEYRNQKGIFYHVFFH